MGNQTSKPPKAGRELTDMQLIDLIRKSIWKVWQRAPEQWKPLVIPKFRGFLKELEETGDLGW